MGWPKIWNDEWRKMLALTKVGTGANLEKPGQDNSWRVIEHEAGEIIPCIGCLDPECGGGEFCPKFEESQK